MSRPAYVGSALATLKQSERLLKDHEDQAAAAMATTALTMATLALVKQQQIANQLTVAIAIHRGDVPPHFEEYLGGGGSDG